MKKKSVKKVVDKKITKKESPSHAVKLKQTTLSESFGRGSLRARLRPRVNAKDYKDASIDSLLLEKSISPDKRKSFVLLEDIRDKSRLKKQPIYKVVKLKDKSTEDKDSVYDFHFDYNDPDEKPAKTKRKKKATRKPLATKKKKTNLPQKNVNNNNNNKNNNNEASEKTDRNSEKDSVTTEAKKSVTNDKKAKPLDTEIKNAEEIRPEEVPEDVSSKNLTPSKNAEEIRPEEIPEDVSSENLPPSKNAEEKSPRARICSIETLSNDRKVSFAPNPSSSGQSSAKFNPFRSTQSIFKPRSTMVVEDMMEHSLLNKSLSPIKRGGIESFDPASPWRPPLPATFSSVRQIVQSTPQMKKNLGRVTQQGFRIDEKDERDENEGAKASPKGEEVAVKRTRNPLGVRISNAENIQASNLKKKETVLERETNPSITKLGRERKPLGIAAHYGDNKGNSGFADRLYKSPKKNDKAVTSLGSPGFKRRNNNARGDGTQDFMPQKRDSGVVEKDENSPPSEKEETKLFKQSNLNTFLNIDEMPESISINTSHGIFGDARSTPMPKNLIPRVETQGNIDNCFGFDEDCDSDGKISPIKFDKKQTTPVKKMFQLLKGRVLTKEKQGTARISLGEIKNTLYPRKEKKFDNKAERGEDKNKKREMADAETKMNTKGQKTKKSNQTFNPVDFSDTFDVLSESGNGDEKDKSLGTEIALFADLEPVHFTQPPRWSYAKKRERKQYWSSDEEDDDDENERDAPVLKKRKLAKINKVEEKKIDEWVKSVNETFQEIDDFDLVVEKLS